MLPTTLARGRATARGYGELLTMLNPAAAAAAAVAASGSIPGLSTYRYSPYTIPNAAGSAAAAAALSAVATTQQTSVLNPVVSVAVSQTSQPGAVAASPHAVMAQQSAQQPPCTTSTAGLLNAAAVAAAAQQQLNLQQIQFLGLAGPAVTQQQQPSPVQSVSVCGSNSQHLAAQILALNNQAVAAAAAAAAANAGSAGKQQRAGLLNDSSSNVTNQANFNGLNYSMNDLINLQGLQQAFDASAAANFQVPVGL